MLTDQHSEAEVLLEQHSTQRFRQQMDIHIQRQLSPRPGKRAGQLSSSTTIRHKWIKGKETTKTDWVADSRLTDKHHSSTEVHLLLNNKQTLWCLCANPGVADVPVKVPSSALVTCVWWRFGNRTNTPGTSGAIYTSIYPLHRRMTLTPSKYSLYMCIIDLSTFKKQNEEHIPTLTCWSLKAC